MTRRGAALSALALAWLALAGGRAADAGVAPETPGTVLSLPAPSPHWFWVGDLLFRRSALIDADSGRFLGMLSSGVGVIAPSVSAERGEIYLPETYYSRGSRGQRTDVVTVYDVAKLAPVGEIQIPPKRADVVNGAGLSTLLDDARFLAVFNLTPATSVTIVDVVERRVAGEIAIPGCSLVYAAGKHRFASLCGDGSLLLVTLDETGREAARLRSEKFFNPVDDPIAEKGVRHGERWLFFSFEGIVHTVDFSGEAPRFEKSWSLLGEADREAGWRVGGTQNFALHQASGRLFALVHEGGPGSHKEPGSQVWVYELASQRRVQEIPVANLVGAFFVHRIGLTSGIADWVAQHLIPNPGADSIAVTQDAEPRLLMAARTGGTLAVYDAQSGARLRYIDDVGLAPGLLQAPWR
jgi:methylamine dehydrogenase heavy chain